MLRSLGHFTLQIEIAILDTGMLLVYHVSRESALTVKMRSLAAMVSRGGVT